MRKEQEDPEKIRIYLVDDHPSTRMGLRAILCRPGLEIVGEASSGRGAVEGIPKLEPQVVLLDIRMPDKDGLSVLRKLKPGLPDTSFIMFTAFEEPEYLTGAVAEGAAGFALKTMAADELVSLIRQTAAGEECLPRAYWVPLLRELEAKRRAKEHTNPEEWPELDVQILHFMAHGQSNARIAELLELKRGTLLFRIRAIFARLGAADRTQAVVLAIGRNLLKASDFKE